MTFRGLKLMLSVIALAAPRSLAAPSTKLTSMLNKSVENQAVIREVQDLLDKHTTNSETGSENILSDRKTEIHHNSHSDKQHHAISTLIHLLLTISSAFAPLIGAIVGPLLTNIANGITWAISHTIASGFSPPHGLFSPELSHGNDHIKEHLTSYTAQGHSDTVSADTFQVQQPIDSSIIQAKPATVDDTRNEVKRT